MGRNLPELSPRERRNAPWNQPSPDWGCDDCGGVWMSDDLDHGCGCPECGSEKLVRI